MTHDALTACAFRGWLDGAFSGWEEHPDAVADALLDPMVDRFREAGYLAPGRNGYIVTDEGRDALRWLREGPATTDEEGRP